MILIDSHAHLTCSSCVQEADTLVENARQAGIDKIINICTDLDSLRAGLALHQRFPSAVYNVGSTTPHDVAKEGEAYFETFAKHARQGDLVAIGETGLDYYYEHSPKELQVHFLRRYLKLARECQLPVVIHCRDAFQDFFKVIDEDYTEGSKHLPGLLHCFTGTLHEAQALLERGWNLSFSGIITYKKSEELRAVAREMPLDKIFIETDTPYLSPQSKRGKSNQPAYLLETAQCFADLKGIPLQALAEHTLHNTLSFFNLT